MDRVSLIQEERWVELRDDRGRLYARLEERQFLLEVRRNHESVIFDLREYLDLRTLEIDQDLE